MSGKKPELQNIDAETQIFTPAYVAKYLAQNSIGRIWLASKPSSKVKDEFGWYVDSPQPEGIATLRAGPAICSSQRLTSCTRSTGRSGTSPRKSPH